MQFVGNEFSAVIVNIYTVLQRTLRMIATNAEVDRRCALNNLYSWLVVRLTSLVMARWADTTTNQD